MIELLNWLLGVQTAHAQTVLSTSTISTFVTDRITDVGTVLWSPLGAIFGLLITVAIVGMIFRKGRGVARNPR